MEIINEQIQLTFSAGRTVICFSANVFPLSYQFWPECRAVTHIFDCVPGETKTTVSPFVLGGVSDGQWHVVEVHYYNKVFRINHQNMYILKLLVYDQLWPLYMVHVHSLPSVNFLLLIIMQLLTSLWLNLSAAAPPSCVAVWYQTYWRYSVWNQVTGFTRYRRQKAAEITDS